MGFLFFPFLFCYHLLLCAAILNFALLAKALSSHASLTALITMEICLWLNLSRGTALHIVLLLHFLSRFV
jgi:hypothetical protein